MKLRTAIIAAACVSSAPTAALAWTGDAYYMDPPTSVPPGAGSCNMAALDSQAMSDAWRTALVRSPEYSYTWSFGQPDESYFCQPGSAHWWCNSHSWTEYSRAVFYVLHGLAHIGSPTAQYWAGMQNYQPGYDGESCLADFRDWYFGDRGGDGSNGTNMDFLNMYSCLSSNVDSQLWNWDGWLSRAVGLHIGGGFHGQSWSGFSGQVNNFTDYARTTSVPLGWIYNLTYFNLSGDIDQCATPWVIGTDSNDAWGRWNETYVESRTDPVPANYLGYWYYCSCCALNDDNTLACTPAC